MDRGRQWDMYINVEHKYGVVHKDVFDETYQSSHTAAMNRVLNRGLKACAVRLRAMAAAGEGEDALQAEKESMLGRIYGFLCSCYGEPPASFYFEFVDKDKAYHLEHGPTPLDFCA